MNNSKRTSLLPLNEMGTTGLVAWIVEGLHLDRAEGKVQGGYASRRRSARFAKALKVLNQRHGRDCRAQLDAAVKDTASRTLR